MFYNIYTRIIILSILIFKDENYNFITDDF